MVNRETALGPQTSLADVNRSVPVAPNLSRFKKFLAFAGPGFLVSVGYMDPGNWGTDLAGGSRYGYQLLWVILASNLMAILLQVLCARLGLVTRRDLAQSCRDYYKKPAAIALWLLCEIAIIACDLAEVIGSAVALNLLGGKFIGVDGIAHDRIPLVAGVFITGFDVLLLLGLMKWGFRKIEAVTVTLVATVALCFAWQVFLAHPNWGGVLHGTFTPALPDKQALFIAVGILGATVMPHNLYLHSSIVQTRNHDESENGVKQAVRYATLDTVLALGAAFFVNAAILIVAASAFHRVGKFDVGELQNAHELLTPLLGGAASTFFAVGLLASGQSSTVTGTLAGQIVMEGFLHFKTKPWLRRLITRLLAIVPAIVLILWKGERETTNLLVLSQVVLSMQLPFAIFPLLAFTSDKKRMGIFANPMWLKVVGYAICVLITGLNVKLLWDTLGPVWVGLGAFAVLAFAAYVTWGWSEKTAPETA